MNEESIFSAAIGIDSPSERAAYLDEACAGDIELRARVDALLDAHEKPDSLLASPQSQAHDTVDYDRRPLMEGPGTVIGNYKLLQCIGEGGFGVVYMADQQSPVRRKVALKIIKPGMDTRQVIARFEAERQALAMMDHANIARVLDGGTTELRRPYFVMELVKGVPITEYCDKNQLSTRERLELFVVVCQAVQHAHQKGIIHRDLKPSNVMVTLRDGQPVVKVIDFGVSKAINHQLTEKTLFTAYGQMVGTPQYMSPEQAEMSCLDVDTRSDIYSLGVLLYELLTGTTPLEAPRLQSAGYAEMQRMIREEEPPKPSTRLSTSRDQLTFIAKHHSASPERLCRFVRGDLDWIVMKALEKDRTRRYENASSLAKDLLRFLNDELVEARPPSRSYRVRKFVRRNRGPVVASIMIAGALIAGTVAAFFGLYRAQEQKQIAEDLASKLQRNVVELQQARIQSEQTIASLRVLLLDKALMFAISGDVNRARQALVEAKVAHVERYWEEIVLGHAYLYAGKTETAELHFARGVQIAPDSYAAHAARIFGLTHDYSEWVQRADRLYGMVPSKSEDYLFRAEFETWIVPDRALRSLEKAVEWRESTLAQVQKGLAQANQSLVSGDIRSAESAVEQMAEIYARVPDNAMVLASDLYIHLAAIHVARREKRSQAADRYLARAKQIASKLEPFSDRYYARRAVTWLAADFDEDENIVSKWTRLMEGKPVGFDPMQFAAGLYEQDENGESVRRLREAVRANPTNAYVLQALAYLTALRVDTGLQIDELIRTTIEGQFSRNTRCVMLDALLLSGDLANARQTAELFLTEGVGDAGDPYRLMLRYVAGHLNEDEFRERFRAQAMLCLDADADYCIALVKLAEGDRMRALERFQSCVDRHVFTTTWYWWAKAFVSRMRRDHAWPEWIEQTRTGK